MTVLELIEALESLTPFVAETKPVFLLDDYDREFPIEVVEHADRVVIQIKARA